MLLAWSMFFCAWVSECWACGGFVTYRLKRPELIDAEENGLVLVHSVLPAVILVDALQIHNRWVVLDKAHTRCDRHHERQMELQVSPATLLTLRQDSIEDTEQLNDALLPPRAPRSRELDSERMSAAVMAADLDPTMANTNTANQLNIR